MVATAPVGTEEEPSPGSKLLGKTILHARLVGTVRKRIAKTRESLWDPVNPALKKTLQAVRNMFQRTQKACEWKVQRWHQRAALNLLRTLGLHFQTWPKSCGQCNGRVDWRVAEMVVAAMLTQQTSDKISLEAYVCAALPCPLSSALSPHISCLYS